MRICSHYYGFRAPQADGDLSQEHHGQVLVPDQRNERVKRASGEDGETVVHNPDATDDRPCGAVDTRAFHHRDRVHVHQCTRLEEAAVGIVVAAADNHGVQRHLRVGLATTELEGIPQALHAGVAVVVNNVGVAQRSHVPEDSSARS